MKRILLFLATNLAVILVLSFAASLLGVDRFLTRNGLDLGMLLGFAALMGFGGSFISLLMSKPIAKWSTGAQVIESPANREERWLFDTVSGLSARAGIAMPEVAIYEGAPNAFATGASRNHALVAVSTGLLHSMNEKEIEAVLGHEIAHVANGDMVTLTLIQGVVNTFVIFISRVIGFFVDQALRKDSDEGPGIGYMISVFVCEMVFGILASVIVMYFSRIREFRADAGSARLLGSSQPMISALQRLAAMEAGELPQNVATSGIAGHPGWMALFSRHPPIEERIAALSR
ncbi:MAG: protease HtpX [Burkholderiales bacterium]|nr:protease HtpX [Burkholderiales bacterium]